jgi:uncharacterized protein YaaR (DUF327 family)
MKIRQEHRVIPDSKIIDKQTPFKTSAKFDDMLHNYNKTFSTARLDNLLVEIDKQGRRLNSVQTLKDLQLYKKLIKDFVKEAVEFGMELSHNKNWNQHGQARSYTLVKQIDEQLMDLTNQIISSEKKQIDILKKIGEINGLLINLYA